MALDDRVEQKRSQWDLYMLYAPGVKWDAASAARPASQAESVK